MKAVETVNLDQCGAANDRTTAHCCDVSAGDLLSMLDIALKHHLLSVRECVHAYQALLDYLVSEDAERGPRYPGPEAARPVR